MDRITFTGTVLAVDPGPEQSAYVMFDGRAVIEFAKVPNKELLWRCGLTYDSSIVLVVEQVAAMGMAVGAEVFETVFWSGRFAQQWRSTWDRMKRHEVKMHLCGNTRAKDGNIRQALIDRFGPGKQAAIGTKKNPGPLYGVSGDCWQALALAITYHETKGTP